MDYERPSLGPNIFQSKLLFRLYTRRETKQTFNLYLFALAMSPNLRVCNEPSSVFWHFTNYDFFQLANFIFKVTQYRFLETI